MAPGARFALGAIRIPDVRRLDSTGAGAEDAFGHGTNAAIPSAHVVDPDPVTGFEANGKACIEGAVARGARAMTSIQALTEISRN